VRVIGIDQRLAANPGEAVIAHTATFEVTPKQGEIIALAGEIGKISLTLRSLVPGTEEGEEPPERPADSRLAEAASVTLDSDISPLLPKIPAPTTAPGADFGGPSAGDGKRVDTGPVTILRGKSNKTEAAGTTSPMEKGS
jgi:pilus assembly protein CpaB